MTSIPHAPQFQTSKKYLKSVLLGKLGKYTLHLYTDSTVAPFRCVCGEGGRNRRRRPIHRFAWRGRRDPSGERRGGGRPQPGPGDEAHDPREHSIPAHHAGLSHAALSRSPVVALCHHWIRICRCKIVGARL